jgi:hypothetical protein
MSSSKEQQTARDQKFIAAFNKYFGKKTKITVNETEYTPAQVTSTVQGRVDTQTDVETTRGNYFQAVAKAKVTEAQSDPVYDDAKQAVLLMYGSNPAVLSEFGLAAKKKPGPRTVAAKQAAVDQMLATRAARHTMGSRQRKQIKGVVASTSSGAAVSTPSVAPSAAVTVGSSPAVAAVPVVGSTVSPHGVTGH